MDNLIGNGSDCNNTQSFDTSIKLGSIYQNPSENIFDLNYQKYPDRQLPNTKFEDYLNQTILPLAQKALREFGQSPDFASKMNLAFGDGFESRSERLCQRQSSQSITLLESLTKFKPVPFEILPSGQIQAKGAFGGDKIYISEALLDPETTNPQVAVSVLLEEMGHYLDSQINAVDSPGDEGAIFAKLVQNQPFAVGELAALKAEDDRGVLNINGKEIEVEQASLDPGIFEVDGNGKISVDFLADAGAFQSEMAIFSLKGMEGLELGSASFIQEAARRALSNSNLGRIVIKDAIEGAKFDGELGEANKNSGNYAGVKTFDFTPGDRLVIMLVPKGTVEEVFKNPALDGNQRPLFSIASANPNQSIQLGQLVPGTFGWEDLLLNASSDADYNDLVFQLKGVTGHQTDLGQSIAMNNGKDWQSSPFAEKILNHVYQDRKPPILMVSLAEDTGLDDLDGITSNPQIVGYLTDDSGIRKLQAKFAGGAYVDIFSFLKPDNSFSLGGKQLAHILGDRLGDGYYELTLRAEDKFGNVSESIVKFTLDRTPPNFSLKGNILVENSPANAVVGTFCIDDANPGDPPNYSLVAGTGDTDNAAFEIVGNELRIKNSPDFETKSIYSIRVKTTDLAGLYCERMFTIDITNVNESPIALTLSANSLPENSLANALVGTLNTQDPDVGDSHTYSLVTGTGDTDNSAFTLVGKELRINNSPDFETKPTYSIRVKTTDASGLSFEQILAIDITNVNEAPVNIALDKNSVLENAAGAVIGNITVTDPDAIAVFLNNTVTVSDNRFEVINNNSILQLKLKNELSLDYETEKQVPIALTATDAGNSSLTYSKNFTIDVIDVDEKPPSVSALLTNDTGVSNSDRLTLDPTIKGETINTIALLGSLNGNTFVDLTKALNPDGSFTISLEQYELLTNGSFPDGNYNLVLKGKNIYGNESPVATVNFTLDRTPPALTFDLAPESDKGTLGDRITTDRTVNLIGKTEAGLEVIFLDNQSKATADNTGAFTFANVSMPVAGQAPFTMVTVDAAGNQGQVLNFLTREGINGAPKITSNPVTTFDRAQQTTYTYQVAATDPDGDALTYNLLSSPLGAEISANGLLSFNPVGALQPSYDFSVEVSDGRGGKDTQTFKVEVPNAGIIRGTIWNDVNKNGVRDNQLVQGANPDVIYVLDVSGSTDAKFVGNPIGDLNGDNLTNTRLDAEIAAFIALNQQLIKQGLGTRAQVAIVVFSGTAGNADMELNTPGVQLISTLGNDSNGNGTPDIEEILRSIKSGGAFGVDSLSGTNPEAALRRVEQIFNTIATKDGNGNIIFLTDGEQNRGSSVADEVARLKAKGFNLSAFGVGDDASLSDIKAIDPDAVKFTSIDSIVNAFSGLGAGSQSGLEPGIAGVNVYLDSNNNGVLDLSEFVSSTVGDNPNTVDVNETGQYQFNNLVAGNYVVREVIPTGFEQTFPVNASTGSPNFHTVEVKTGQVVENLNFGNSQIVDPTVTNSAPIITSSSSTNITVGSKYTYQVVAFDRDRDLLKYQLNNPPAGLTIDNNGLINWTPTAIGTSPVEIQVNDSKGGITTQKFDLVVGEVPVDTEAPQINIGLKSSVLNLGETLDLQVQGIDNVALTDLKLSFNGEPVTLTPNTIANGVVNTAAIALNQLGVFEVLATGKDAAGNVGTKSLQIRVIDPNDKDAPIVKFDLSQFDPLKPITDVTNIIGTVNDPRIEFYRVEMAPVSSIDLNNPGANDPDFITIAEGKGNVDNGILAQIDPRLYRNDNYYVRIYAQDINGNITVEGTVLGISSETKPGEFSLEYTDLTIPLTGIPIEIKRVYHSLDAQVQGDFGYGWNLAMQDAQIQEASRDGRNLSGGNFEIGGNAFTVGTRVTLTTPDGRRVGYTFNPTPVGASFFGTLYKPTFTPDPGVFDTLEVDDARLSVGGDGSVGLPLFGFLGFNPSEYRLKTKEGIVYRYDQSKGLLDITDRNNNKLTYTDAGITSSTGQSITFKRDAQNRITEIIDPNGKSIKYSYDADGDLSGVSDRNNANTQFEYENPRPHYLTEVVDPLGRSATRTEYDEQGRMKRLIDADGNALDLTYTNGASSQTIKDPLGNNITRVFDKRGNVIEEIDQLGGITKRTYDANDNLLSQTDPEGNIKAYTYDSRGNRLSETDGEGKTKLYTYNQTSKLLTETDALGNVTTYTYDANDNLTTRKDALGNTTTYKYAANGLLTEVVDANGKTSTFSYDGNGNLLELTDPTGAKTKFTYDSNGRVISNIDAIGAITNSVYDAQGRLIEQADPEGSSCGCGRGITKVEYNAAGEKIAEIDALGRRTEYRYNSRGLLIETILPDETPLDLTDNSRTKKEYDALDRIVTEIDELGRKTQHVYDKLGRKIETILPDATPLDLTDNPRTKKEYDKAGRVTAEIDERGNRSTFTYDKADRLITRTNALNEVTTYTYDADGRQSSMTDALGRKTTYAYDANDRLLSITYANNTTAAKTYDPLGRVIAETDLAGITTKYEYDALGRLTAVVDALNQRTEYKYDAVGNQIEQKDANNHVTKFEYDTLRRRKGMELPGGQRKATIHNNIGNLLRETDANGVTTTYEYNARNWITKKSFSDGTPTETFTYTLTGQLATVTDNRGTTSYSYDERDRLLSRTEPDGRKIQYIYDLAGNILTLNAPSGTTSYTYDALNRIDTVIAPDLGKTDYTYDKVGNLTQTDFANGVAETQQYDLLNRLTNLENRNQTGIISSYTYTLDAMGNRTKVVEQDGRTVEYAYDPLYRLTQEKITDAVVGNSITDYKFDSVGNRLERTNSVLGKTTYTYDVNDRLLEEVLGGKITQYQYDAKGNLTAKIENGANQATYQWNAKGELAAVEVTENGVTGRTEFEYDHTGIRVSIKLNGEETRFLIDTNQQQYAQVIEEYQPNGTVKTAYVHGWDLISQTNPSGTDYYQVDGLGSTRQLTNNTGAIRVEYDYDAYGNLTNKVGNASNNYLFAGEQFDPAVDGYYLRARYYDPATGRFTSSDPFEGYNDEPITLQDYLYVGANPVNEIDPSGEAAASENGLFASAISRPLLASVRQATLTSNVGTVTVRGLRVAIDISCTFLKIASALSLAAQGLLSESSDLDCGFNVLHSKAKQSGKSYLTDQVAYESKVTKEDPCDILAKMLEDAKRNGNRKLIDDAIQAQKFLGCRNIRKRR